jgi:hypothetical protein
MLGFLRMDLKTYYSEGKESIIFFQVVINLIWKKTEKLSLGMGTYQKNYLNTHLNIMNLSLK